MAEQHQEELFDTSEWGDLADQVEGMILETLRANRQPSPWEVVVTVEQKFGWKARWAVRSVLEKLVASTSLTKSSKEYLQYVLYSGDLDAALQGRDFPKKEIVSTVDSLVRQSSAYRGCKEFREMIDFIANFRDYAPYNNMLVRIQNPSCSFYATERDWASRFTRRLKEDARPMLILAPMHPVMLVYELDQTEGPPLPEELSKFARFEGQWRSEWLQRTVENAATHDRIRIDFKPLSSTNAGFATLTRSTGEWKMRIAVHDGLDEPSRYGTLCHELAHIYLGHLGGDKEGWWPSRSGLNSRAAEIEAEATAFIVTTRFGLMGSSAAYVSRYLKDGPIPASVSLDSIAKGAGRLEEMAQKSLSPRKRREPPR